MKGKTITIEITHDDEAMLAAKVTTMRPVTVPGAAEATTERTMFVDSVDGPAKRRPLKLWKRIAEKIAREFGK